METMNVSRAYAMAAQIEDQRKRGYSSNLGALPQWAIEAGYYQDSQGNSYYPDGQIMFGPAVSSAGRERSVNSPVLSLQPVANRVTLPNGQVITQEQYAALLAAQGQAPASQVASGIGGAFSGLAASFGVSPTTLALLAIGGLYLLTREPPQRKTR